MHTQYQVNLKTQRVTTGVLSSLLLFCGCQLGMQPRHEDFALVASDIQQSVTRENFGGVARPLPKPDLQRAYSLPEYLAMALARHPNVQASRWAVDAAAWQVPVAASLEDPQLSITALPAPIQTAAGPQNVILGISQKVPLREKQAQKEKIASAAAQEARARLATVEREVVAQVRDAFAELLFRQQALDVLHDERELLAEVTAIIVALYKTEKVSQQDVAQAELAELQVEQELIVARQQLRSAQITMARLLHIAPSTQLLASAQVGLERPSNDVDTLLEQAIASQPELHAMIAKADHDRMTAGLAKLDYIPDPTLGASWVGIGNSGVSPLANGEDAVLLNLTMNLPVYGKRIEAKIKSAEAQAISSARSYDNLRDETLRVVYDEYTRLESKRELITLLRSEVVPKASETLDVSVKAYSVSKTDVQQVLDNWRKLIRYELAVREMERDYRKSLALLERAVGTDIATTATSELIRLPPVQQPVPNQHAATTIGTPDVGR